MKKPTKSIITSSLLALAFGAMSVGTTFALFTSKAETTINVESGLIDLKAPISVVSAWELGGTSMTESDFAWTNSIGGSITKDENNIVHLNKLAPGDGAIFALTPNNSGTNINTKVRLVVTLEGNLAGALNVEVKAGTNTVIGFNGAHTGYTPWEEVEVGENPTAFNVKVEFPDGDNGEILFGEANHDNQYQNKTATLVIGYEAVQGNAQTDDMLQVINTKLMTEAYLHGENETMYDALQDLSSAQVAAIETRSYVWSVEADQFFKFDAAPAQAYKYFKMYGEMPDAQTYSIYATGTNWTTVGLTGVGFDAGSVSGITSVSYVGASDARTNIIRTNSAITAVNVDAANDTISHYGTAGSLNINAIAGNSYHEHGKVAFVEIKTGRMALEKTAEVEHIHLATSEVQQEAVFNNITISKAKDVEMPDFSRDPVTIPAEGRLVVALQEGTEDITAQTELDYVWLTAVGIYEQVTVSESNTEAGNNYAVNSTNQEKKDTAQQIANNITANVGGDEYTLAATTTDGGQTWTYTLESGTSADDITENVTVTVEENVATVSVGEDEKTTKTENGMTTEEKNDFQETLVENAVDSEIVENNENYIARIGNTFYEDIHKAFEALQAGETLRLLKDYRVEQDSIIHVKTSYNEADTAFGNLSADKIFDGCNHTIEFADGVSAYLFGDMNGTIQNFRVLNSTKSIARISKTDASNDPITFKNIEVYGNMNVDGNTGAFVVYITGQNGEFRFIDCVNNCNMTGIGTSKDYNAAFIGYFWGIYGCEVYLTRCINNADIVCGAAAFIGGNPWLNDANKTTPRVYLTDCENRGKIQRTYTGADSFTQNILYGAPQGWLNFSTIIDGRTYSPSDIVNGLVPDTAIRGNKLIIGPVDSTLSLTRNNDGTFSFHGLDGAAKYEVSVGLYVRTASGTYRYYAKQVINHIENQMDYDANIKDLQFVDYDWLHDHDGAIVSISQWNQEVNVVIYNEQQYFLVPEEYKINGGVTSGQMYTVVAYDSNNNLLASATLEN